MTGQAMYNLAASDGTTAQAALGQLIEVKGATWMYVKAGAAIVAYDLVQVESTGVTTATNSATTTTAGSKPAIMGCAQFAVAIGEYFWLPIGPFHLREDDSTYFYCNALISCAQDVKLYTTATAGSVDDSVTTLIEGLVGVATITAAAAMAVRAVTRLTVNTQS